ncbi:EAL domain-containing protein [Actinomadura flavalba]|uniref:EAL domain-containing protein n=1 Tax=Actinomadura flavalba TaxID=1120938 RepID=UPI000373DA32|nr:EAL domain-containing protein [Actinomadura flavalba]
MTLQQVPAPTQAVFEPVVDLGTGAVVAVAAHASAAPGGDPVARDVERVAAAARATAPVARLPLQVSVAAGTLAAGGTVLDDLHAGLCAAGRRPREVTLCASGGFAPAQRPVLAAALRRLRQAGYLVGFGGLGAVHLPLDLLADGVPSPLGLDPELARRAAAEAPHAAVVASLVALARRLGTQVQAPGLDSAARVARLRALGVRLARGPALAPPGWRPGEPVTVPLADDAPAPVDVGPRVAEFTVPAVTLPDTATAAQVLDLLNAEASVTSVVLLDERQRPSAAVDRTRFLLEISGPYGHALHAARPAARLADPPGPVPRTVPAMAALRAAGRGARVRDDLIVVDEVGRCLGIVRVADLLRALT